MRNLFLFITTMAFSLISCSPNEDVLINQEPAAVIPPISYAGNWSGTYSGDDSGKIYILILADGTASITFHSNYNNIKLTAKGSVKPDGTITISATNGTRSTGKMEATKMSGTWINPTQNHIKGTWAGKKH